MASQAAYQYYYRVDECKAKQASDANCICWHNQGDPPRKEDAPNDKSHFSWRVVNERQSIFRVDSRKA